MLPLTAKMKKQLLFTAEMMMGLVNNEAAVLFCLCKKSHLLAANGFCQHQIVARQNVATTSKDNLKHEKNNVV
jgi:hypothetical protein